MKWLLLPFAWLYHGITALRNWLYDMQYKPSTSFRKPFALVLGNLTVGGTGKTPHTELLLEYLRKKYAVAMLSRGYGRATKGYRQVQAKESARTVGDEPLQVYQRFTGEVPVVVCEKRVIGMQTIAQQMPQTQLVVLDDAFQHRALEPSLALLLTRYDRLFYTDYLLPFGRLRESRKGTQRADAILVTKCPMELAATEKETIRRQIQPYCKQNTPIFFSSFRYGNPRAIYNAMALPNADTHWLLVTSIAQPKQMYNEVQQKFHVRDTLFLNDHQPYTPSVCKKIVQRYQQLSKAKTAILTTEKDAVKMQDVAAAPYLHHLPIFVLPVEVQLHEPAAFWRFIDQHISLSTC